MVPTQPENVQHSSPLLFRIPLGFSHDGADPPAKQENTQNGFKNKNSTNICLSALAALLWLCTLPVLHQSTPVYVCQSFGTSCRLSVVQAVPQFLPLLQSSHGQPQVLLQTLDLSLAAALHPTQLLVHLCVSLTGQPFLLQSKTAGECHFTLTIKDNVYFLYEQAISVLLH